MSTPLKKPQSSSAKRVAAHRKRMRDKGLVQRVVWVWDTKSPEFIAEAKRESEAIAAHDPDGDVWMKFLEEGGMDWPKD